MNLRKIIPLILLFSTVAFAQQSLSFNGKTYPATPQWDFVCENYALSGSAQVQIAKTEKGGLLQLSVATTEPTFAIAGNVYVELADMSVIVCTDKNFRANTNEQLVAYYVFSAAEMNRLKKSEIRSIRFSIQGKKEKFASQTGYFTAVNKKSYFSTFYNTNKKSFDTAQEVQLLFPM